MTDRRLSRLLPVERWPTVAQAQASHWFQPVRLGPVQALSRTWVPAMVPWRATGEGQVTPAVLGWYERFAVGQPGVIVVEATGIRDVPSGPLLRAGHDRFIEGLSRLTDAVRRASGGHTRLFIQLIDFLAIKRRPPKDKFFAQHLVITDRHREYFNSVLRTRGHPVRPEPVEGAHPSAGAPGSHFDKLSELSVNGAVASSGTQLAGDDQLRAALAAASDETLRQVLTAREFDAYSRGLRERVTDTHLPHIAELPRVLPELFAAAARRCEQAGFDGIELHFAHAYTMASFLSALNDRTDGYGGTLEHRVRAPLEVFAATRAAVSSRIAVGCRYLADEIIEGGSHVDEAAEYGVRFARAGFDFISLSRGGKFEDARQPKVGQAVYPYTGPSGHECMPTPMISAPGPWGRNVPAVARVKKAIVDAGFTTPVVACGGISSFWQAEAILSEGEADIVASARQSIADPDWFRKLQLGRGEDIRRCFFTNYCEGLDQSHEVVTCQRWDRAKGEADDLTVARTADGRRTVAPPWKAG